MQCGASAANCVLLETWLGIGVAPIVKELSASATQCAGVGTQGVLCLAKHQLLFSLSPPFFFCPNFTFLIFTPSGVVLPR